MIEINLLPEEFRPHEGTPLPMFLTIVIGFVVSCSLAAWGLTLAQERTHLKAERRSMEEERDTWRKKAEEIDAIIKETNTLKKRQETIINISRSKILWSVKLTQLTQLFQTYDKMWIESMTMRQSGLEGSLTMTCNSLGDSPKPVTDFQTAVQEDTLFWYHFKSLDSPRSVFNQAGGKVPPHWSFTLTMNLKDDDEEKPKGR